MSRSRASLALVVAFVATGAAACGGDDPASSGTAEETADGTSSSQGGDGIELDQGDFFVREDFERQLALAEAEPQGPADQPWLQQLDPDMVDTEAFAVEGERRLCVSNIAEDNGWRVQGMVTLREVVATKPDIVLEYADAQGDDNQQISDIESFVADDTCDVLIVAPYTAGALTPAVELACEANLPTIVLATEVETDCYTTYVSSVGGYLWGWQAGQFIDEQTEPGDDVLALRILPGVAELEWRWGGAVEAFLEAEVDIVAMEFTEQDPTATKQIVTDAIQRFGQIDAVWMDAGGQALPTIEAFVDAGLEVPPIVGEDENGFLQEWVEQDLTAIAPVASNFQWRTAVEAAEDILDGTPVPARWIVPQPAVRTAEEAAEVVKPELGLQGFARCGCTDLAGYPEAYQ